jgi:hypothetical protein
MTNSSRVNTDANEDCWVTGPDGVWVKTGDGWASTYWQQLRKGEIELICSNFWRLLRNESQIPYKEE